MCRRESYAPTVGKGGQVVAHVSNVKPLLTDKNKAARLAWCVLHVHPNALLFNNMHDTIHVDEKLFYLTAVRRRYYLLPGEEAPHRQVHSKRFITKVMMLAAVERPRWNTASGPSSFRSLLCGSAQGDLPAR
ncbi:hypothetical protein Pcac1_g23823 [Phytophthora cactorum]|nr:hypothetical protein Pcac1_g23823 [Phytophthora cactorum]